MAKLKTTIRILLKLGVAITLIVWMAKKGYLNFDQVAKGLSQPVPIALSAVSVLAMALINSYRWNLLLRGQEIFFPYLEVIKLSWIGFFFNTVLPGGALGGDVVKSYYIAVRSPGKRPAAVTTILIDRLLGFTALIYISWVGLLLNLDFVLARPALQKMSLVVAACGLSLTMVLLLGISSRVKNSGLVSWIFKNVPFGGTLEKIHTAFNAYQAAPWVLVRALGVAFFAHCFNILAFYFALSTITTNDFSFTKLFFIVPIGLITTVIPISPAGLGIGQVAFLKLFEWVLGYPTSMGADACTIMQTLLIAFNLFGVIPYIMETRHGAGRKGQEAGSMGQGAGGSVQ